MAESVGALRVDVSANTAQIDADLRRVGGIINNAAARMQRAMGGFASKATEAVGVVFNLKTAFAGLVGGALVAAEKKAIDFGDSIAKTAQKIGISTDSLQELRYGAELAGTSAEDFDNVLLQLSKRLGGAQNDVDDTAKALGRLGIDIRQLKDLKADDVFKLIADRISAIKDPMQQARIATDLFGRTGQQILPFLKSGSEGIAQVALEARKLGVVLSAETLHAAEEANDEFTRIGSALKVAGVQLAAEFLPVLRQFRDAVTSPEFQASMKKIADTTKQWISYIVEHKAEVLAIVGALAGAKLGAPFGPTGAIIGSLAGGVAGYAAGVSGAADEIKKSGEDAKDALTTAEGIANHVTGTLKAGGANLAQIAAVLASIKRESDFNPNNVGDNGTSFGLFQLHKDRLAQLKQFAAESGTSISDVTTQLAFWVKEMGSTESAANAMWAAASSPEQAAAAMAQFERFAGFQDKSSAEYQKRLALTEQYFRQLQEFGKVNVGSGVSGVPRINIDLPTRVFDPEVAKAIDDVTFKTRIARGEFSQLADGFPELVNQFQLSRSAIQGFDGDISKLPPQLQALNEKMAQLDFAKEMQNAAKGLASAFEGAFEEAVIGGKNLKDSLKGLLQDIARIALRMALLKPLENAFGSLLGGGAAGGSGGGLFAGIGKLFGFANGGSFQVGGAGGIDSQLVAFRASPDETVTVSKGGARENMNVTYAPQYNVAQGADPRAIAELKQAMDQDRISFRNNVITAMRDAKSRRIV